MHPLKRYLSDIEESVHDFAERVGASRQTLYRIIAGNQTPKPALARKIVAATGAAVTLDDLFSDECEGEKIIAFDAIHEAPELEANRLKMALAIVINHLDAAEAPSPAEALLDIATEAVSNTYAALAPVTTRQGPVRLTQALRPVLEEILRDSGALTLSDRDLDRGASLASDVYFQNWRTGSPR